MEIRTIDWNSPDYEAMIGLRIYALLEPIGIPASYIHPNSEKDDIYIGAFGDNGIVGCCVLTPKDQRLLQLRQMAVTPRLQGKGLGAQIIRFAEEKARERGFSTLMMHARDPVIDFYKKCGYEIAGPQFFEVGMGHHKMEKKLD